MKEAHGESFDSFAPKERSLENLMSALSAIKGYKAAAIMTCDGELLYDTSAAPLGKLGPWMKVFNTLFAHTCNLSETSGFLACQQVAMRTSEEIVLIRSSAPDCQVGIRLLVILDHQGNEALIHQKLDELLPPLLRCLSGDPDNLVALKVKDRPGENGKNPCSSGKPSRMAFN